MTLRNKENTHVYSMVNTAKAGAINFEINSDLSALSWEAYDNHLPLDQLWEKYHAITSKPRLNAWLVWVLVGSANASFCRLFSGDWIAVAAVFVATLVGFRIKQVLGKHHINHYFIFTISAFVASLIASVTMWQQWGNTPDIAINIRNSLSYQCFIFDSRCSINQWDYRHYRRSCIGRNSTTHQCVFTNYLYCIWNGYHIIDDGRKTIMTEWQFIGSVAADAIGAAIAAIGFSVISNPPRRVIPCTAILAAIGHSIRFVLLQYAGLDLASASFIAAFSIGLLSHFSAYKLFCPATVLYIPALLPMIPGMYAYRTVFSLIKFLQSSNNDNEAIHYLLEIFKNGITTASVLFALAVGATIPIFIFYKRAFTMTRASRRIKK